MSEPRRNPRREVRDSRPSTSDSNNKRYAEYDSSEEDVVVIKSKTKRVKKTKVYDNNGEEISFIHEKAIKGKGKAKRVEAVINIDDDEDDDEVTIVDPIIKKGPKSKKLKPAASTSTREPRPKRVLPTKVPIVPKPPKEKEYEMPDLVDENGMRLYCPVAVMDRGK
jgi:hypothetical protein